MMPTGTDARSGFHACAVPVSDEQLWEMTAEFLADGLSAGERVMYFDDGTADAVLERLGDDRVPTHGPLADGQFSIVPQALTGATLRSPLAQVREIVATTIDESLAQGFPGFRMTGQMSSALAQEGGVSLAQYDAVIDELLLDRPTASLLCFYDNGRYSNEAVEEMRRQHREEITAPAVYDDGLLRITRVGPSTVRLAGEVDHSNRPVIARLLKGTLDEALRSYSAPTEITLDMASLRFLDVAGAVILVHAAEAFPSSHRLVLAHVRQRVLRVLDRCGAPFAAQLSVTAQSDGETDEAAPR